MKKIILKKIILIMFLGMVTPVAFVANPTISNGSHSVTDRTCVEQGGEVIQDHGEFVCRIIENGTATFHPLDTILQDTIEGVRKDANDGLLKALKAFANFLTALILEITGFLLRIAGLALNVSIAISVVHMKTFVESVGTINEGWRIIRDLINMSFIFILLYIAISTILGGGAKAKKLLISIVIVALTINFSLFMTKFIVDGSNIVALQFYKPLVPDIEESSSLTGAWESSAGLANIFIGAVKAAGVYDIGTGEIKNLNAGNTFSTVTILGSVLFLILAFIFFAGAILFIIRLVILMLLMVFSPVAFIGLMLPQAKSISSKWWKTLMDQVLFAPVFMILIYLVARIVTSPGFISMSGEGTIANALSGGSIKIILNYIIVCAFLIATIVISKSLAGKGGDFAFKAAGAASFGAGAWVGRQSAGRLGNMTANSAWLKEKSTEGSLFSRGLANTALYGGKKFGSSSFDARNTGAVSALAKEGGVNIGKAGGKGGFTKSYEDKLKAKEQRYRERADSASTEAIDAQRKAEKAVVREARELGAKDAMRAKSAYEARKNAEEKKKKTEKELRDRQEEFRLRREKVEALKIEAAAEKDPKKAREKMERADKIEDGILKEEAQLKNTVVNLTKDLENADHAFGSLSESQRNYAAKIQVLNSANETVKNEKLARKEHYAETLFGTPRTASTREAARKVRTGQSPKDQLAKLLKDHGKELGIEDAISSPETTPDEEPSST